MGCCRRVEYPLNSFLTQRACNFVLIPPIKTLLYFMIRPKKVCTVVGVDNSWFTSCNKPSKTHYEGISRQGVGDFQIYSSCYKAGKKAAISFICKSARCGHFSCNSLKFTLLSGTFRRLTTRTLCPSNLVPKSFN